MNRPTIITTMPPSRRRTIVTVPTPRRTAADIGKQMAAEGASHEEIRGTLAAGANERHEARVLDTLAAACSDRWPDAPTLDIARTITALASPGGSGQMALTDGDLLAIWATIDLDLGGHGGEGGSGVNGATDRLPPFKMLGEGRWRAYEGRVYRSAAMEARKRVEKALGARCREPGWKTPAAGESPFAVCLIAPPSGHAGEWAATWTPTPHTLDVWAPWFGALKVRLLRLPF